MARVTIEDCLRRVNNRFVLVHLGAKRVIQLRKGAKPLVEAPKNKEVVLALREIAAGAVDFDSITQMEQEQLVSRADEEFTEAADKVAAVEEPEKEATSEPTEETSATEEGRVEAPEKDVVD